MKQETARVDELPLFTNDKGHVLGVRQGIHPDTCTYPVVLHPFAIDIEGWGRPILTMFDEATDWNIKVALIRLIAANFHMCGYHPPHTNVEKDWTWEQQFAWLLKLADNEFGHFSREHPKFGEPKVSYSLALKEDLEVGGVKREITLAAFKTLSATVFARESEFRRHSGKEAWLVDWKDALFSEEADKAILGKALLWFFKIRRGSYNKYHCHNIPPVEVHASKKIHDFLESLCRFLWKELRLRNMDENGKSRLAELRRRCLPILFYGKGKLQPESLLDPDWEICLITLSELQFFVMDQKGTIPGEDRGRNHGDRGPTSIDEAVAMMLPGAMVLQALITRESERAQRNQIVKLAKGAEEAQERLKEARKA